MAETVGTSKSRVAMHRAVLKGLPFADFKRLQADSGLPGIKLTKLVQVPPRTLERRRHSGRFSPPESERILRLRRLVDLAVAAFDGDHEAAKGWLMHANVALANEVPLDLAASEVGAREVEEVLLRLDAGVYS